MEIQSPTGQSNATPATLVAVRTFSKTIAMTNVGLGFFGLLFFGTGLYNLQRAILSRAPLFLIPCAILLSLGIGFIYVIFALYQRRNWARYAAVSFWLICLIWSAFAIVRNGLHPQPASGPFQYSNVDQLAGARFAALVTPYLMAILEMTVMYCLLRKDSIVNQFRRPG